MKTKTSTYPTQFYLNKIADQEKKRIVLFVTCDDGIRMRHSTGHAIHPDNWSFTNSIPKTNVKPKHIKDFGHPDQDGKIMDTITQLKGWVKLFTDTKIKAQQQVLSSELKKFVEDGGKFPKDPTAPIKQLPLVDTLEAALNVIANKNGILQPATVRNLEMSLKNFKAFNESLPKLLTAETVNNPDFKMEFDSFCNGKPWSASYKDRLIKDIKKLFNLAHISLPADFKRERVKSSKMHLEPADLARLDKLTGLTKEREAIRDFFLIDCECGLRVSDLKWVNLVNGKLIIQKPKNGKMVNETKKTKSPIAIPVTPIITRIMSKYNGGFPRLYDMNHINREIKEIAKLAGIEKWKEVSNHTARRSYFTNKLDDKKKVDVRYLSVTSGVSVKEILATYDRSKDPQVIADKLSKHPAYQRSEFA